MTLTFSKSVGNSKLMQKMNQLRILNYIRSHQQTTRQQIVHDTGISASAVTNIVNNLISRSFIIETGTAGSALAGRKAKLLFFNPSVRKVICVSIDPAYVIIALTDLAGNAMSTRQISLQGQEDDQSILELVSHEIQTVIKMADSYTEVRLAGIAVATSGIVLNHAELLLSTKMQWKSVDIKHVLESQFRLPVFVQNKTRTKIMHQLRHHLEHDDDRVIFLDMEVGIGLASFVGARLDESVLGEIGHTTIVKDGLLCFCGNHGCLEMYCNVPAVIRQTQALLARGSCPVLAGVLAMSDRALTYEMVLDALHQGDPDVSRVIESCGQYLGIALANIISLFQPDLILINGERLLTEESIFYLAVSEAGRRINSQLFSRTRLIRVQISLDDEIRGIAQYITEKLCTAPILEQESAGFEKSRKLAKPNGRTKVDGQTKVDSHTKVDGHTKVDSHVKAASKKPHSSK